MPVVLVVAGFICVFAVIGGAINDNYNQKEMSLVPGMIYGSTIQEKVWYGMRSLGFSEISTAAAMGNIHYESGTFNPEAIEGGYDENTGGIGICQWTNNSRGAEGRNTQLKQYAESKGTTWKDENTQVEFLLYEVSGTGAASGYATYQLMDSSYTGVTYYCDDWIKAEDTGTLDENELKRLTEVFCFTFERPNAEAGRNSIDTRYNYALEYYEEFHGKEMPDFSGEVGVFSGDSLTDSSGKTYKIYKQGSAEFKSVPYPARGRNKTIGGNGCGPTCCAIIGSAYGYLDTPKTIVETGRCYSCYNDIPNYFKERGFIVEYYNTLSDSEIKNKLQNGYDIVVLTKKGYIGNYSVAPYNHWYTLLDVKSTGEVFVGDPIVKRWRLV